MTFTNNFKETILEAYQWLSNIPLERSEKRPSTEKWSIKEILGHLIDSANNNHRRFTKAQWEEDMIFNGYAQAKWVNAQHYQQANWKNLLELWKYYNLHICFIMENTPPEKLNKAVRKHNLHQIAMIPVPETETVTLAYFMKDYIYHLEHHLKQIKRIIEE